jgi:hypothetical protein
MAKEKSPRGNAGHTIKPVTSHDNPVAQALATSIWELIERDRRVRLADLRARVRDRACQADLVRALVVLVSVGTVVISGSMDGPVVEVAQRGGVR